MKRLAIAVLHLMHRVFIGKSYRPPEYEIVAIREVKPMFGAIRTSPGPIETYRGYRIISTEAGFLWTTYGAYLQDRAGDTYELEIEASTRDDAIAQAKQEIDRRKRNDALALF